MLDRDDTSGEVWNSAAGASSAIPARRATATRRSLLGLAGLLAGGRVLPAEAPDAPSSSTAEARLKLALHALEAVRANIGRGLFPPGERDPLWIWSRRRMEARLELSKTKAERIAAAQEHLNEMKAAEALITRLHAAGDVDRLTQMEAEYRRLEAESWLEREKAAKA
jgi:hypothetical protein